MNKNNRKKKSKNNAPRRSKPRSRAPRRSKRRSTMGRIPLKSSTNIRISQRQTNIEVLIQRILEEEKDETHLTVEELNAVGGLEEIQPYVSSKIISCIYNNNTENPNGDCINTIRKYRAIVKILQGYNPEMNEEDYVSISLNNIDNSINRRILLLYNLSNFVRVENIDRDETINNIQNIIIETGGLDIVLHFDRLKDLYEDLLHGEIIDIYKFVIAQENRRLVKFLKNNIEEFIKYLNF